MDSRRVRLQLRIVQAVMRVARPEERQGMRERAEDILEAMAMKIDPEADPSLAELLAKTRAEVTSEPD